MPRFDVITLGSATQDVYLRSSAFRVVRDRRSPTGASEEFAFGSKVELDEVLTEVGGGATNTAVTFRRQGLRTACVCRVGMDAAGDEVVRILRAYRVDPRFVMRDHVHPTAFSALFLSKNGERSALVARGASAHFTEQTIPWKKLKARWYYVCSLGGNIRFLRRILQHAATSKAQVALNPGKDELRQPATLALLRKADVLLLNREEAELLFHTHGPRLWTRVASWRKGTVVITDGAKGSYAFNATGSWRVHIKPVKAVDTTGAGDAFGSGFVASLIKHPGNIQEALRLGSMNSAGEVQQLGAKHGLVTQHAPKTLLMKVMKLRLP